MLYHCLPIHKGYQANLGPPTHDQIPHVYFPEDPMLVCLGNHVDYGTAHHADFSMLHVLGRVLLVEECDELVSAASCAVQRARAVNEQFE